MKIFKILGGLIVLVIALIVAVFVYLSLNLNSIVKSGVEEVGPELTQTPVSLEKVDISLRNGRVALLGFSVANPENFTSPNAFEFKEFVFKVDPQSLRQKVIVIDDIVISGIAITAEQKGSSSNLQELKKAVDSYLPPGTKSDSSESAGADVRFMVRHLKFDQASLNLITEKYGERSLSLPSFEEENIGNAQEGITAEELASIILKSLNNNAKKAAERELKKVLTDEAKSQAKEKIKGEAEKGLDKLRGLIKD